MADGHVLVLGGQRSGKSRHAEQRVLATGRRPVYVATATAGDDEMAERIARHRARRGEGWRTVEEPLELAATLEREAAHDAAILVDCLTLWLTNIMMAGRDPDAEGQRLIEVLGKLDGVVVIVSNEVGAGVIPADPFTRRYVDALGTLNQRVAENVGTVVLVTAGIPSTIKAPD